MTGKLSEDLGLGPIEQVAYVVENMERAVAHYGALFGPFQISGVAE